MCHLILSLLVNHRKEVTCNTGCTPCTSHYSKSTPSRPYHTLETQKGGSAVEGTTYNHGRPEGISEDQHPMNQFLGMLRAGPPIRTQIYGIIPRGSSLPTSPDPAPWPRVSSEPILPEQPLSVAPTSHHYFFFVILPLKPPGVVVGSFHHGCFAFSLLFFSVNIFCFAFFSLLVLFWICLATYFSYGVYDCGQRAIRPLVRL